MSFLQIDLKNSWLIPSVAIALIVLHISVSFFDMEMYLQSYMALAGSMVAFVVALFLFLRWRLLSSFEFVIILYMMLLESLSLLNGNDWKNWTYMSLTIFSYLVLFDYYKDKYKVLLLTTLTVLSIGIYCQLVQCVLHPEMWMVEDNKELHGYILGGNYNQMGSRLIIALALSVVSHRYSKWLCINTVILFGVTIGILFMVQSMTSLSCIILFTVLCLIPNRSLQKLSVIGLYIGALLFQCIVCFSGKGLENNDLATWFIIDVLNKDITFTGRTEMWDSALRVIADSPLWGYGFVDGDWYLSHMSTLAIGAHNFILNNMIFGGIIAIVLYLILVYKSIAHLASINDSYSIKLIAAFGVMSTMMLFEVYGLQMVFLMLSFMYYYPEQQDTMVTSQTEKPYEGEQ